MVSSTDFDAGYVRVHAHAAAAQHMGTGLAQFRRQIELSDSRQAAALRADEGEFDFELTSTTRRGQIEADELD